MKKQKGEKYSLNDLRQIVKELRHPETGCPWDKKQSHQSLKPYVIEEAYEVAAALDKAEPLLLADELGDLLLQIVLHSRLAEEEGTFGFEDVCDHIARKLVRRHPHVFADVEADDVETVWKNWEDIKSKEKKGESVMESIPMALPALMRSEKAQKKAARLGFDWDKDLEILDKIVEEIEEFKQTQSREEMTEELGDILFSVVNLARRHQIPAEEALGRSTEKFIRRFQQMEKMAFEAGKAFQEHSLEEMESFWQQAKAQEKD